MTGPPQERRDPRAATPEGPSVETDTDEDTVPPGCDIASMLRRRREAARRLPGGDPWPVRCRGERWSR